MNAADTTDLLQFAVWTVIVCAGPAVGSAMVVGIIVALVQALTQIQEMTLTFVPKMVVIFAVITLSASFIGSQFDAFTESIYGRIEQGFPHQ